MTTTPRHLIAVPDDPDALNQLIETGLREMLTEHLAGLVFTGRALWNVETDMVIDCDLATPEDRAEVQAAQERHLQRVADGQPLPDHVRVMQDALRRVLRRQEADARGARDQ